MKWATLALAASFLCCQNLQAQSVTGTVNEDGFIVLSGELDLLGIEIASPSGSLIPKPDDNPHPFSVMVSNTSEKLLIGSIGTDNAISLSGDLILDVGYDPMGEFDLVGSWGGPLEGDEGSILFAPQVQVPEPSSNVMAVLAVASLLATRRRKAT